MQLGRRGILVIATFGSVWMTLLVLGLSLVNSPWDGWRPATCMPTDCFCEAIRPSLIKQPANTASSFLFVAVAFVIAARPLSAWRPRHRGLIGSSSHFFPRAYAGTLLLIGLGSALFHASLTFVGQTLDVLGMYLLITLLLLHNVSRLVTISAPVALASYCASNAVLLYGLIVVPGARRYVFAALATLVFALEVMWKGRGGRGQARLLGAAAALLVIGFIVWLLDLSGTLCWPNSLLQGHAFWHAAGAAAVALIYAYLESVEYELSAQA